MKDIKKLLISTFGIMTVFTTLAFAQNSQQVLTGNFYYTGTSLNKKGEWQPWTINEEQNVSRDRAIFLCRNHNPLDYTDFVCHWAPNDGGPTRDGLESIQTGPTSVSPSFAGRVAATPQAPAPAIPTPPTRVAGPAVAAPTMAPPVPNQVAPVPVPVPAVPVPAATALPAKPEIHYGRFYYTGTSQNKQGAWIPWNIVEADHVTRPEARQLCEAHNPEYYTDFVCHWAPENGGSVRHGLNNF